jgi:hypothetical protein
VDPISNRSQTSRLRPVLALLLIVWEPAGLALVASSLVATLADRGIAAVAWLVARLLVTGFGVGAGMALWRRRPGAMRLTRWAVGLSLCAVMITALTPIWPHPLAPGVRGPATTILLAWYAGWWIWTLRAANDE